jgi:hypothetical protein
MDFFEQYNLIAKKNGFSFDWASDDKAFLWPSDRMLNKKCCYMSKDDLIYFASDSFGAKAYMSSTYSGVYTTIPVVGKGFEAKISRQFWIDFITGKRVKTGNSYLDKHLNIKTNDVNQVNRLVDLRIADKYLQLWDKYGPLKLVMGMDYLPVPAEFRHQQVIGIELDEWVFPEKFEATFMDWQGIVMAMKNRVARNIGQ